MLTSVAYPARVTIRVQALLLVLVLLSACGVSVGRPSTEATPNFADWRWAGPPVALVGRPLSLAFERDGVLSAQAAAQRIHVEARCVGCAHADRIEFDAVSPNPRYELDPGVAEAVVATVEFPAEGVWQFAPLAGEVIVRSPTSSLAPVVVVRPWSTPLSTRCGAAQVETAVMHLMGGFNTGSSAELVLAVPEQVDFSITGAPLAKFVTSARDEVVAFARTRSAAGERLYPYLVYAAGAGDGAVDLGIYLVRQAPDLPSPRGYRTAFAGSRLLCADLLLRRFNADLID